MLKDGTLDPLIEAFAAGEKSPDNLRVGIEYENFGTLEPAKRPLNYKASDGEASVETVLRALGDRLQWREYLDDGVLIGLLKDGASVQLEPSGQLEFSGAPHGSIHDAVAEIDAFEEHKSAVGRDLGVSWMWAGHHPVWTKDDFDLMPKRRYKIMRRFLPTKGSHATEMMHQTTTVQSNLDYTSERSMGEMLRTAMGLSSILGTLFANSPLKGGKRSGHLSYRNRIWEDVDRDRCGLLDWVFTDASPTYERYAQWALKVPLFFIEREGQYLDCAGLPFAEFIRRGFQGHRATLNDWHTHLSTLFPDVRLKTYLELRSADCVPPALIPALPALSKGMLYNASARDALWDLVKRWTPNERWQHRSEAAKEGFNARCPGGHRTLDLAGEMLSIIRQSLGELAREGDYEDESVFLRPLDELIAAKQCLATQTLHWFNASERSDRELIEHYTYDWAESRRDA